MRRDGRNSYLDKETNFKILEKALRAFASSSGGAACPGGRGVGVRGQPWGSGGDPKVIPRRFKQKKNFVTDGQTDVIKFLFLLSTFVLFFFLFTVLFWSTKIVLSIQVCKSIELTQKKPKI